MVRLLMAVISGVISNWTGSAGALFINQQIKVYVFVNKSAAEHLRCFSFIAACRWLFELGVNLQKH